MPTPPSNRSNPSSPSSLVNRSNPSRRRVVIGAALLAAAAVAGGGVAAQGAFGGSAGSVAAVTVPSTPAPTVAHPVGTTTHVSVDSGHRVALATSLRPGVHRLVVTSGTYTVLQVARPATGYTVADAVADLNATGELGSRATLLGGVSASEGHHGIMWQRLTAGTYWVLDRSAGSYSAADIAVVTVSGSGTGGSLAAPATLSVRHDDTWSTRPAAVQGYGIIRLVNHGTTEHAVTVVRLRAGQTLDDVRDYLDAVAAGRTSGQAPYEATSELSTGAISPGAEMTVRYTLPPGRYAVLGADTLRMINLR